MHHLKHSQPVMPCSGVDMPSSLVCLSAKHECAGYSACSRVRAFCVPYDGGCVKFSVGKLDNQGPCPAVDTQSSDRQAQMVFICSTYDDLHLHTEFELKHILIWSL